MADRVGRANLIGVTIAAVAGAAWTLWGASGLPGSAAVVVRVVGIVLAVGIVLVALRLRRVSATTAQRSTFATRSYRVTVAVEVLALAAGAALLSHADHSDYVIVWTAAVVGVHFLIFGRLFAARFYLLGVALLAAAVVGAVINLSGAGRNHATAATGLLAAASLLLTAGVTLRTARPATT